MFGFDNEVKAMGMVVSGNDQFKEFCTDAGTVTRVKYHSRYTTWELL